MTGNEYLRLLRRGQSVTLAHDLSDGTGRVLAKAGEPFIVRIAFGSFGHIAIRAVAPAGVTPAWSVEVAPGDLHDASVAVPA